MCFSGAPIINQQRIHKSWAFVSFSLLPIKRSEDINFSAARDCEYSIVLLPPKPPILLMLITVLLAINELKPFNKLLLASAVGFHALCLLRTITALIHHCSILTLIFQTSVRRQLHWPWDPPGGLHQLQAAQARARDAAAAAAAGVPRLHQPRLQLLGGLPEAAPTPVHHDHPVQQWRAGSAGKYLC